MPTMLILFIGFVFSVLSLNFFSIPYMYISLCWLLLFIILFLRSKTSVKKALWFNVAFVALLFGVIEIYSYDSLNSKEKEEVSSYEGGYTEGYYWPNEIFGYGPVKDVSRTSRKFYEGQLIYDVTYTIDIDGRRITPSAKTDDQEAIVFLEDLSLLVKVWTIEILCPILWGSCKIYKSTIMDFTVMDHTKC